MVPRRKRFVQSPTEYLSSCERGTARPRLAVVSSPAEVPASPDAARRRRPGIAITLIAVIGALVVVSATTGRPPGVAQTPASRFLATDGYRLRFTSAAGTLTGDWAVDQAPSLLNQGPSQVYSWLGVTELDWSKAVLARLSTVQADAAGTVTGRYDDFYSVSGDGIRAELSVGGDGTTQLFVPGRLDLSATPSRDHTWTSDGALGVLSANGKMATHGYHVDYSSAAATGAGLDGCIVVTARQQIDQQGASTWQNTWCPGRGVVAFTADDTTWTSTTESVAADPGPADGFDWSSADRLSFAARKINSVGDQVILGLAQPPVALIDGTALAIQNTTNDLIALDTSEEVPPIRWRARPGGRPTSVAAFTSTTVVATSERELIAYGPNGDWRWRARLSDLTIVPPVRIGAVIAVAGLDGSVTGYDAATGAERWRWQVGAEIRVPMATSGNVLVVIDQTGRLACLDASGAQLWETDANTADSIAISTAADPVVVVPANSAARIDAYHLDDGSDAWQVRTRITARNLIGLDGQMVVRDGNRTVSMDAATGRTRWTWDAERTYNGAGGGNRVLLVADDRVVLLDGAGQQIQSWPTSPVAADSGNTWLATAAGHVLLFGPKGMMLGVAG